MSSQTREDLLRKQVIGCIERNQADVAVKLYETYVKVGGIVTSPTTLFKIVLACILAGKVEKADDLAELGRHMSGYTPALEADHLRELAIFEMKQGDYDAAETQLRRSQQLASNTEQELLSDLAWGRLSLYRGRRGAAFSLEMARKDIIKLALAGELSDVSYLREATWWLMLTAARFGDQRTTYDMAMLILDGENIYGEDGAAEQELIEDDPYRRRIAMRLRQFRRFHKVIARIAIAHSKG